MIKKIALYSVVSICLIALFVLIGSQELPITSALESKKSESKPIIVIDAGHGGEDGGAIGIYKKVQEKDLNLEIAKELKEIFVLSGFEVNMIREEDTALYDNDASSSIRNKKVSDLQKRVEITNSSLNNILISIHQNKFSDSKYFGTQVFYSQNNPDSIVLAECMKKAFVGLIQPENKREIKPAGKNIFLLSKAKVPAVIVECGFLSNKDEADKLIDKNYQKQLAFTIYCGFMDYYNSK